ncbi:MAG: OmpH family outer membrane protein [Candidatus Brocadiales bacterium]
MKLGKLMFVFFAVVIALPAVAFAEDLRIGVVNLNQVFENYKKREGMEEDFKDLTNREEELLMERQDELMSLREELQLLERGSEARKEMAAQLEKKGYELELDKELALKKLAMQEMEYYEELYQDINDAIEEIGSQEEFDLIIKKQVIPPKSADLRELMFKIRIGTVLYFSESLDITDMVVEYLNERYSG